MTTQQANTIRDINDLLASDRTSAELNSRPVLSLHDQAIALYAAMMAAKDAGKLETARALANELRPLLSYLD